MTMNIVYGRFTGQPVHPLLRKVIEGVNAKAPLLKFVAADMGADYLTWFDVLHDVETLGKVYISYTRNGTSVAVASENIKKQRGNKDTKVTKNANVAIKTCLEVFRPKPQDKVAYGILRDFNYATQILEMNAREAVTGFLRSGSRALTFGCFLADFQGGALPADIQAAVMAEGLCDKVARHRAMEALRAAVTAKYGVVLAAAPDNAFVMVDLGKPDVTTVVKDTYSLPTNYQEKLAILKIMDPREPVPNVGFKYAAGGDTAHGPSYFLAGGDTVTKSV